jgi:hypothetical protein
MGGQQLWGRGYFCGTVGAVDEATIHVGLPLPFDRLIRTAYFDNIAASGASQKSLNRLLTRGAPKQSREREGAVK